MVLQYLDALKALGASPSTKYVLPLELTELAQRVGRYVDRGFGEASSVATAPRAATPDAPSLGTTGGVRRIDPAAGTPPTPPAPPTTPPEGPPTAS
jgi:hypothetical protein